MRKRTTLFLFLLSIRTALFVLVTIDLFVSIRCGTGLRLPRLILPLLLMRLISHFVVSMMADSFQIPFYPIYGLELGEMSDFKEMRNYRDNMGFLNLVLKNIATTLWIVLIVELYLTASGLVTFNPVLLASLVAGMAVLWGILRWRKRRAQTAA